MASRKIPLICSGHSRPVHDLQYSNVTSDGFFLVSACLDGKPMLRNGTTGDWVGTFLGHKGAAWAVDIDPNAVRVATGSADYTAKIWDALTGEEKQTFTHTRIVKSVAFSKDETKLATGGQEKTVYVWDMNKGDAPATKLEGHSASVKTILWKARRSSDDNPNILLSGGQDNLVLVWDLRTLQAVKSINTNAPIQGMEISLDGKFLITSSGKDVCFWSSDTFDLVKKYTLGGEINSASLSPDGQTFAAGGADFWAHVYDFNTGKELEVHKGHHGPVHIIRFAPDGNTFASGSEDGTIRLWQSGEPHSYGLWEENKDANHAKPDADNV